MSYKDPEKQKKAQHESYLRNKDKVVSDHMVRRRKLKIWFRDLTKNNNCCFCGEKERICLDYHHIDPSRKIDEVSKMLRKVMSKENIIKEYEKCICLCSNCHRKVHAGLIKLPV